jgi:hypothetical protein
MYIYANVCTHIVAYLGQHSLRQYRVLQVAVAVRTHTNMYTQQNETTKLT